MKFGPILCHVMPVAMKNTVHRPCVMRSAHVSSRTRQPHMLFQLPGLYAETTREPYIYRSCPTLTPHTSARAMNQAHGGRPHAQRLSNMKAVLATPALSLRRTSSMWFYQLLLFARTHPKHIDRAADKERCRE